MKRKLSLILIISFAISLLLPNTNYVAEQRESHDAASHIYISDDTSVTRAAPLIQEVTLRQGESYDFVYPVIYMPEADDGFINEIIFQIKAHSDRMQLVSVDLLEENNLGLLQPEGIPDYYFVNEDTPSPYKIDQAWIPYNEERYYELREAGQRITNLSSGSVTYKFGVKIRYRFSEPPYFDL